MLELLVEKRISTCSASRYAAAICKKIRADRKASSAFPTSDGSEAASSAVGRNTGLPFHHFNRNTTAKAIAAYSIVSTLMATSAKRLLR